VVNGKFSPNSKGLEVIRHFLLACDFPTGSEIFGFWGENAAQKVKISINTCLKGTSLRQSASFELLCVKICSLVQPICCRLCVSRNKKTKTKIKGRDLYISAPRGGAIADTIFTRLGRVAETHDVITHAKSIDVKL